MDNLISRKEAIRIASGYCHPANIANELEKLPGVDVPDTNVGELVSKHDAIETALIFFVEYFGGAFREDDQLMLKKRMEELSSVQTERCEEREKGECPYYAG